MLVPAPFLQEGWVMYSQIPAWLAAIATMLGLLVTVITTAVVTTWRISVMLKKRDERFVQLLTQHESKDSQEFALVRQTVSQEVQTIRSEFGTTVTALREFINQQIGRLYREHNRLEVKMTESLDEYVKRSDFTSAITDLRQDMKETIGEVKKDVKEDISELKSYLQGKLG